MSAAVERIVHTALTVAAVLSSREEPDDWVDDDGTRHGYKGAPLRPQGLYLCEWLNDLASAKLAERNLSRRESEEAAQAEIIPIPYSYEGFCVNYCACAPGVVEAAEAAERREAGGIDMSEEELTAALNGPELRPPSWVAHMLFAWWGVAQGFAPAIRKARRA